MKKIFFILLVFLFLSGCSEKAINYKLSLAPSQQPPKNLSVEDVPQFVSLGFDDNSFDGEDGSGGMKYITDLFASYKNPRGNANSKTYDGVSPHFSFYSNSMYIAGLIGKGPGRLKRAWRRAVDNGNELGNHTNSHPHGMDFSVEEWEKEIRMCSRWIAKPFDPEEQKSDMKKGIGIDKLYGFRTPFLEYGDNLFKVLLDMGFIYDCSIEEGYEGDQDGTNFFWPYTLDNGSPGNEVTAVWNDRDPVGSHPGLWEIPVYVLIVPPDEECEKYGIKPGFRERMYAVQNYFDPDDGKITGFDWNLWIEFGMTKEEFVAVLEYTLDLRLKGNRCPMTFGTHSDIYSNKYAAASSATAQERREGLKEFLDYALSKSEVRLVSAIELLNWIVDPVPLGK